MVWNYFANVAFLTLFEPANGLHSTRTSSRWKLGQKWPKEALYTMDWERIGTLSGPFRGSFELVRASHGPKLPGKWAILGPKMDPKWTQNGTCQNGLGNTGPFWDHCEVFSTIPEPAYFCDGQAIMVAGFL